MSRYEDLNTVVQEGIVAVIRAPSSELLVDVAEALLAGGITVMEITFTVPQATQVLQEMVNRVVKEAGGPPGFPLLGDEDFSVISRYGVFNPEQFDNRKVPHPAVYIIDRSGMVTWKFLNTDARIRADNEDILKALYQITNK